MSSSDIHAAILVKIIIVISVFMPTDYKNDKSERKFVLVCKKLATAIADVRRRGLKWLLLET